MTKKNLVSTDMLIKQHATYLKQDCFSALPNTHLLLLSAIIQNKDKHAQYNIASALHFQQ